MKIAIFTCSVSRTAGGLLDAVRDLYQSVIANGGGVELTVYSYLDNYTSEDLPSWGSLDIKLYEKTNPFFYSMKVRNDLISSTCDILHVHGMWRYPHAFINSWKGSVGKPIVLTPHGMLDPYIIKNQGLLKRVLGDLFFARKAFKNVDCFHALNMAELRVIRKLDPHIPIAIIPNGINLPDHLVNFNKDSGKRNLLFLGRLHPKKGVDLLIHAVGQLAIEEPELLAGWIVDLVGWPQENFDVALKDLVKKYKLEDTVIFHGGLFGEAKQKAYSMADAYILPSHSEGLPMTVLEAWSWEKPVLMTPFCNIPEGFESKAAILIKNNISSVKSGIVDLLRMSDAERRQMGRRGRELVESQFTWEISANKMKLLYEWLQNRTDKPEFIHID